MKSAFCHPEEGNNTHSLQRW